MDTRNTSLGEIARLQPSATRVFLRHGLDFCCGGRHSLADACTKAGLDTTQIVRELEAEELRSSDLTRWDRRSPSELVEHIISRYHDTLRADVPPLIEAARRVERVHRGKPAVPVGLGDELDDFWAEMQTHMMKEERVLFPMLRQGVRGPQVYMPVRVMEQEHDAHGEHLAKIRELTGNLEIPPHACATWRALYQGLEVLETDLMEHIHLENNVLFARASAG